MAALILGVLQFIPQIVKAKSIRRSSSSSYSCLNSKILLLQVGIYVCLFVSAFARTGRVINDADPWGYRRLVRYILAGGCVWLNWLICALGNGTLLLIRSWDRIEHAFKELRAWNRRRLRSNGAPTELIPTNRSVRSHGTI